MRQHELSRMQPVDTSEAYRQDATGEITLVSEQEMLVYWIDPQGEEFLAGRGVDIDVTIPVGSWRCKSEGRVWAVQTARTQLSERTSDDVFTSLDRPAALSPEMAAVHRMMRRNEIERENQRAHFEQLSNQLTALRSHPADVPESAASEEGEEPDDASGSGGDDEVQQSPSGSEGVQVDEDGSD